MFESRPKSPEDIERRLIDCTTAGNFVDGETLVFYDDSMAFMDANSDDFETDYRTFKIAGGGFRGSEDVVPGNRAVYVSRQNGFYVHIEDRGFAVTVPVRGSRDERKRPDSYTEYREEPTRFRFYYDHEIIPFGSEISEGTFSVKAAARAIHDVVRGVGADSSSERYDSMIQAAKELKLKGESESKVIAAHNKRVEQQLYDAQPKLKQLNDRIFKMAIEGNSGDSMKAMQDYWGLRDTTLESLGLKLAYSIEDAKG